jgi:hypothetical protein
VSILSAPSEVERTMAKPFATSALLVGLIVAGCADMSDTQQRTLTGAAGGTAAGAVLGAIGGNAALGAVAGAAAGTVGGYLWDQHKQSVDAAYRQGQQNAVPR